MVGRRGPGLVGTMARTAVIAGTATAVCGNVARRQQGRANAAADEQYAAQQSDAEMIAMQAQLAQLAQQQAAPAADDVTTQLLKLSELKTAGILSEEEFAAAKAKLLS